MTDAVKVVQAGADQGVRIRDLDEQGLVLARLSAWLGWDVSLAQPQGIAVQERAARPELMVPRR
jgi:hypothetical protein